MLPFSSLRAHRKQAILRELVQKRAMSIICPGHSCHEALDIMNFMELAIHHDEICQTFFNAIVNDNNHRLYKLLPATHETTYLLRRARPFNVPRFTTDFYYLFMS